MLPRLNKRQVEFIKEAHDMIPRRSGDDNYDTTGGYHAYNEISQLAKKKYPDIDFIGNGSENVVIRLPSKKIEEKKKVIAVASSERSWNQYRQATVRLELLQRYYAHKLLRELFLDIFPKINKVGFIQNMPFSVREEVVPSESQSYASKPIRPKKFYDVQNLFYKHKIINYFDSSQRNIMMNSNGDERYVDFVNSDDFLAMFFLDDKKLLELLKDGELQRIRGQKMDARTEKRFFEHLNRFRVLEVVSILVRFKMFEIKNDKFYFQKIHQISERFPKWVKNQIFARDYPKINPDESVLRLLFQLFNLVPANASQGELQGVQNEIEYVLRKHLAKYEKV